MNTAAVLRARVEALIKLADEGQAGHWTEVGSELLQGTLTILEAVRGPDSPQAAALEETFRRTRDTETGNLDGKMYRASKVMRGALANVRAEIDVGLGGNLQQRLAGAVLSDFVGLARAVLDDVSDGAKNVAAVLAAAAFEDTIRRMGRDLAGVMGRDDLADVVEALKKAGILQAPQLGIALSYLKFRNDALHADWAKIARESVHSVLGFVEQLLLKHFS